MEIDGAQDSQNVPEEGNDEVYVPLEILVRAVQDARMESHVVGQIMEIANELKEQREQSQSKSQPLTPNLLAASHKTHERPNDQDFGRKQAQPDKRDSQLHGETLGKKRAVDLKGVSRHSKKREVGATPEPCHNYSTRQKHKCLAAKMVKSKTVKKDDPREEELSRPKNENIFVRTEDEEEAEGRIFEKTYTKEELKDMMGSCNEVRALIKARSYLPEETEYVFYRLCGQVLKGLITKNMFREELLQLFFVARDILLKFNWPAIKCELSFNDDRKEYCLKIPSVGKKHYPIGPSLCSEYQNQYANLKNKHSEGSRSSNFFANIPLF